MCSVLLGKLRLRWGDSSFSRRLAPLQTSLLTHLQTCQSELTCIFSALILPDDEVTVTEDKINAIIKAAGVNVEPFCPGLFAKALSNVNFASLICNVGVGEPVPAAGGAAPVGGAAPASTAAPAEEEKKEEAKQEESEESDDDMGFGLLD